MRLTKSAKAFLDYFALRNAKAYSPLFKKELAETYGLTVEELGSICLKMGDAYCVGTPLYTHLPPHEQRLLDIANAITFGMFIGQEFRNFANPPKEKKN